MAFNTKQIKQFPEWARKQIEEQVNGKTDGVQVGRNHNTKPQCSEQKALGMEKATKGCMVEIDCPVIIRLTRWAPRSYDNDNFIGGAKQLIDAIVSSIGKKGDSEGDGVKVEYVQKTGLYSVQIEIFKDI